MPPLKGLLLCQGQIDSILDHSATENPLFIRILMQALHWGATKGYDTWALVDRFGAAAVSVKVLIQTKFFAVMTP